MQSKAATVGEYLTKIPKERNRIFAALAAKVTPQMRIDRYEAYRPR